MTSSEQYHGFGLVGYRTVATRFENGRIVLELESTRALRCAACGSGDVIGRGRFLHRFKATPVGLKQVVIRLRVPRVRALFSRHPGRPAFPPEPPTPSNAHAGPVSPHSATNARESQGIPGVLYLAKNLVFRYNTDAVLRSVHGAGRNFMNSWEPTLGEVETAPRLPFPH